MYSPVNRYPLFTILFFFSDTDTTFRWLPGEKGGKPVRGRRMSEEGQGQFSFVDLAGPDLAVSIEQTKDEWKGRF